MSCKQFRSISKNLISNNNLTNNKYPKLIYSQQYSLQNFRFSPQFILVVKDFILFMKTAH